jgi:hypothetical protein
MMMWSWTLKLDRLETGLVCTLILQWPRFTQAMVLELDQEVSCMEKQDLGRLPQGILLHSVGPHGGPFTSVIMVFKVDLETALG